MFFAPSYSRLTPDAIRERITSLMVEYPDLTSGGWQYLMRSGRRYCEAFGSDYRSEMLTDHFIAEVNTALIFLVTRRRLARPNLKVTSYWWKHCAEGFGELVGLSSYVSNGAVIAAALIAGFPVARHKNSPNCAIGIGAPREIDA